jgi:ketopantoate reductase
MTQKSITKPADVALIGLGAVGWAIAGRLIKNYCKKPNQLISGISLYGRKKSLLELQKKMEKRIYHNQREAENYVDTSPSLFQQSGLGNFSFRINNEPAIPLMKFERIRAWDDWNFGSELNTNKNFDQDTDSNTTKENEIPKSVSAENESNDLNHDVVFVCCKANHLKNNKEFLHAIQQLTKKYTGIVVMAQNGIPFWYPLTSSEKLSVVDKYSELVDIPALYTKEISENLVPIAQIVGAVMQLSSHFVEEDETNCDEILHPTELFQLICNVKRIHVGTAVTSSSTISHLNQTNNGKSISDFEGRASVVAGILEPPQFSESPEQQVNVEKEHEPPVAVVADCIRTEVWNKLLGNASWNSLSVLYETPVYFVATNPNSEQVGRKIMQEIHDLCRLKLDTPLSISVEERINLTKKVVCKVKDFKASTLQDFEAKRDLELEAIVDAVLQIAKTKKFPMPTLECVCNLVKAKADLHQVKY